jgi:LuxR family transcriptional activator of rhlAB and lasB
MSDLSRRLPVRSRPGFLVPALERLQDLAYADGVAALVGEVFEAVGCAGVTLVSIHHLRTGQFIEPHFSSLPMELFAGYQRRQLEKSDPIITGLYNSYRPFLWSELDYGHADVVRRYWADHGFHDGVSVPLRCVPNRIGGVSAPFRPDTALNEQDRLELSLFCQAAFHGYVRLSGLGAVEAAARLSSREVDALAWVLENKTDQEIGAILGICATTVRFHIQGARRKLGASGRFAAAVAALRLGLLV